MTFRRLEALKELLPAVHSRLVQELHKLDYPADVDDALEDWLEWSQTQSTWCTCVFPDAEALERFQLWVEKRDA